MYIHTQINLYIRFSPLSVYLSEFRVKIWLEMWIVNVVKVLIAHFVEWSEHYKLLTSLFLRVCVCMCLNFACTYPPAYRQGGTQSLGEIDVHES